MSRRRIYQKMSPLTSTEQDFAEKNHDAVLWYLTRHKLDFEEYYDVAVFGYLKAVKNWFTRPDLRRYSFNTIARQAMFGYISNYWHCKERRIKTISLDAPHGKDENVALMDIITYDNVEYSPIFGVGGAQYS
ncbi:hypothetical protein OBO34_19345 [Clostridiales Family XIII bacterium ASD5510]|uniref:Uncharacterized protein n=1 Tax=Hominibacterium faecale TaxID=2839743 RepID=A0A9J6QYA4_9FIRM|nr:hypothetical protein [Hominibacterium faecale]MCU7380471.1 hypothetical protein [Hominibacterium faecale]